MTEQKTPTRRYIVKDSKGIERMVKATSPAAAIGQVYEHQCRVATHDDVERSLTQNGSRQNGL